MIRRATRADAAVLARIQEESSLVGMAEIFPADRYPYPRDAVRRRWRDFDGWGAVAEQDGEPVGFVTIDPPMVNGLYVAPAAWGSGAAAALHDAALEALRGAGVTDARLWALRDNRRALRFYERRGWRPTGAVRALSFPPHPVDLEYGLSL